MNSIKNFVENALGRVQNAYDGVAKYLDQNPTAYKVTLFACHLFRTISMYGMLVCMPIPMPATLAVMVGGSLLYRASVERFCCFRFTIPSLVGSLALWQAQASAVNLLSAAAFETMDLITDGASALFVCGYIGWIVYQSNRDINKHMKALHSHAHANKVKCCDTGK